MILPEVIDWTGRGEYPTDDGIYANVDNEIYQGDRTRLSKHQLALIARSIGHWWAWLTDETEQTAPMRWGSAYHVAMEGGVDLFKRFYAPGPDVAKNTKAWKDALRGTPDNVVLLKSKEYASILLAAQTIRDHPIAGPIVNSPTLIKELTINYRITFPDCEIPMRSRLDGYDTRTWIIPDYKRTEDARSGPFRRAAGKYGYDMQDYLYTAAAKAVGLPVNRFVFICVEPKPPYGVMPYWLGEEFRKRGERKTFAALEKWREYKLSANGAVPVYADDGIYEISPTRWQDDQWEGVTGVTNDG